MSKKEFMDEIEDWSLNQWKQLTNQNRLDLRTNDMKIDDCLKRLSELEKKYQNRKEVINKSFDIHNDSIAELRYQLRELEKKLEKQISTFQDFAGNEGQIQHDIQEQIAELEKKLNELGKATFEDLAKGHTLALREINKQIAELEKRINGYKTESKILYNQWCEKLTSYTEQISDLKEQINETLDYRMFKRLVRNNKNIKNLESVLKKLIEELGMRGHFLDTVEKRLLKELSGEKEAVINKIESENFEKTKDSLTNSKPDKPKSQSERIHKSISKNIKRKREQIDYDEPNDDYIHEDVFNKVLYMSVESHEKKKRELIAEFIDDLNDMLTDIRNQFWGGSQDIEERIKKWQQRLEKK